ncbi:hypothetical protein MC885_019086 [Smutsia gigantea]|nr:hypothetical protein MC885_019086 [Smutsia gigantea]
MEPPSPLRAGADPGSGHRPRGRRRPTLLRRRWRSWRPGRAAGRSVTRLELPLRVGLKAGMFLSEAAGGAAWFSSPGRRESTPGGSEKAKNTAPCRPAWKLPLAPRLSLSDLEMPVEIDLSWSPSLFTGRQMQYGASYKGEEAVVTVSPWTKDRRKGDKKQRRRQ